MLAEFIIVSFASFIGYQAFRMWLPFVPVTTHTAPIFALAIAAGSTMLTTIPEGKTKVLVAVASTGGVALLNKITDVSAPDPVKFSVKFRRRERTANREPRERIPSL